MVNVYIWLAGKSTAKKSGGEIACGSTDFFGSGHAAILLGSNPKTDTYISFYPGNDGLFGTSARWKTFQEDNAENADEIISLSAINANAIAEFIQQLQANGEKYHLQKLNCSTVVYRCLKCGLNNYIENLSFFQKAFIGIKISFRSYWPGNWSTMADSIDARFTGIFVWTPNNVLRVAKHISRIIDNPE